MLEQPDFPSEQLIDCLYNAYGLHIVDIAFLPLGADPDTAVYRAITHDTAYFVKLRSGNFDETSVILPKWLSDQGIAQIIPPLPTTAGQLWTHMGVFTVLLYPFVDGHNGYEVPMSEHHWHEFGAAIKRLHTANVPHSITQQIKRERYAPQARETITRILSQLEEITPPDDIAQRLIVFLQSKRHETRELIDRAEQLASILQARTPDFTVCHTDIHAGNMLIDTNGTLYIVDWDDPILAPKERDLMFVGGAQGFIGHTAEEEITFFYQGYGQTPVDHAALAYYRYERIILDIAVYCEQLLLSADGGEDREPALRYLMSNYSPNSTIAIAYAADTLTYHDHSAG